MPRDAGPADASRAFGAAGVPSREWFSPADLAALALPGMPGTKRAVNEMAERQDWQRADWNGTHWRPRAGQGGGVEYHLAVLPMVARAKLAFAEHQAAQEPAPLQHADGLWDWYARQTTTKKAKAEARLKALDAVETLVRAGERRVHLRGGGLVEVAAATSVTVTVGGVVLTVTTAGVAITGNLAVTGNITATGTVSDGVGNLR